MVVVYIANANNFQIPIQNLVSQMAWLYRFDYAVVNGHQIFNEAPNEACDLIYFRSTELTRISSKKFQQLVTEMFVEASLYGCIDVFFQFQKNLKQYPFPSDYIRPLNYPYSDVYKNGNKILHIDSKALPELDANEVN